MLKTENDVWNEIDKCKEKLALLDPENVKDSMAIDYYNERVEELELKIYDFLPYD